MDNYTIKIADLINRGCLRTTAGLYHLEILHDDWCAVWKGGRCNCNPSIYQDGKRVDCERQDVDLKEFAQ